MSECVKNGGLVYPQGHKNPSRCNPAGLREQTLRTLCEVIPRNLKELRYGG